MFHRKEVNRIFRAAENGNIEEANRLFRQAVHDARTNRMEPRFGFRAGLASTLLLLVCLGTWLMLR
jgi:hypothetical protein